MRWDIFTFCAGAVVTGLSLLFPQEPELAKGLVLLGILGMGGSLVDAAWRYMRKPLPARLLCSFNQKDIGGCVCPNTILRRSSRWVGGASFRSIGGTSSESTSVTTIVPTTMMEPSGTVSFTGAGYDGGLFTDAERGSYYRVKVTAENGTLLACTGKLISLKRGEKRLIAEEISLPFAPANNADALNKTVHNGRAKHLDFLFISDSNRVELTPHNFQGPSAVDWQSLFSVHGDYFIDIKILSPVAQSTITIVFNWAGNRETSRLVAMN